MVEFPANSKESSTSKASYPKAEINSSMGSNITENSSSQLTREKFYGMDPIHKIGNLRKEEIRLPY